MLREDVPVPFALLKFDGRYVCADNLRFTCILAIIALHSAKLLAVGASEGSAIELFQFAAISTLKFGTIGFFLISGFLLEKNLQTQNSIDLVLRRVCKVFLPWTFWFALSSLAVSLIDLVQHKRAFLPGTSLYLSLWKTSMQVFTGTALWFVPNLLLSLMLLIVFRRYLQSLVFGAVLLTLSLSYSLNLYIGWTDTHHTRAFFGFIFYLWLGHYAAVNVDRFTKLLRLIPSGILWIASVLAVVAEFAEGRLLMHLHAADPLSKLKISTQVFSVLIFLCFFKVQRRLWPISLDVSRVTFGMYLSHVILLGAVTSPLWTLMTRPGWHLLLSSFAMRVTIWLGATALVAALSFMVARTLSFSASLSWIVGSPRRTPKVQQLVDVPSDSVAA